MATIMAKKPKIKYNDGLANPKTLTNPKGGGRVAGRVYPHLVTYPGILNEQRLAWNRMKAQAKFRKEAWQLSWEEFQQIWADIWHLRGTTKESLVLTRIDQEQEWNINNVEIIDRMTQWRRQNKRRGPSKRGPYKIRAK
jgi:hypothetical protein